MIGDARPSSRFATLPYGSHGSFSQKRQLDKSCLHLFYRLDAAEAEMVHRKILQTSGPIYKTLKTAKLFPRLQELFNGPAGGLSQG
jgi:hypothetical protein